jgi:HNH endonuclease
VGKWRKELKISAVDRFWQKVKKNHGCWLWTGATNNKGYGVFKYEAGRLAHRFSFFLHNTNSPRPVLVLHRCDNPICVRPSHLRARDQTDNMRDILLRGRANGRRRSRLTPDDVRAIRKRLKPGLNNLTEIAADYGITKGAVGHIKYGQSWAWLQ